ncbi:hypothetical protein [Kitasatospora sp. NPDC059327]|uniref:hypothetical protein n=1 Tax=Kitasatospora sp. NPDC059327 TaxID=3346803 RepID=UPI00368D853A
MTEKQQHSPPDAPDLGQLNTKATMLRLVAARFKAMADTATSDLQAEMLRQHTASGVKSISAKIGDTKVGAWTVKEPQAPGKVVIADRPAFTDWVFLNQPGLTRWELVIVGASETALLADAVHDEAAGLVVHRETNEVLPGLAWQPSPAPSSVAQTWTADGRDHVMQFLRDGAMASLMTAALQIEPAES